MKWNQLVVRLALPMLALSGCAPVVSGAETGVDAGSETGADGSDGGGGDAMPNDGTVPSDGSDVQPVDSGLPSVAQWVLPRTGPNHFQLPWPSDLTLTPEGYADFSYVPNDTQNQLLSDTVADMTHVVRGFSTAGATYFRFTAPVLQTNLPVNPAEWLDAGSPIQIIDIDPASPEHGRRHPGQFYYRDRATRYWTANTLAVAPAFGFPLRENTRYAVVLSRRVRVSDNTAFLRDADLDAVLSATGGDAAVASARTALAPAIAELQSAGVPLDQVLSLAVFTTQDCTGDLFKVVDDVATTAAPPTLGADLTCAAGQMFDTCSGHYGPSPIYQQGAEPYDVRGTGGFVFDATGVPVIDHTINIRYALAIPHGTPPPAGWPLVIYAHGTGGDANSHIDDGTAQALASVGVASIGFDQIFNGERTVGAQTEQNAEQQFFNFLNITAGRTNNRQAAVDLVQMGRLARNLVIPPNAAPGGGRAITFDGNHLMFFGHSQGGLNGPLWLAAEDGAGAAVLSGAGATLSIALTQKTNPVNIPQILAVALGIPISQSDEIVALHPVITFLQTAVDVEDPVNYGRFIIHEPRTGLPPRHIYQTQGFIDTYAPPQGIGTLALSIGLQLGGPVISPDPNYPLNGLPVAPTFPISLNLQQNTVTGVWQQWMAPRGSDGHFVIFDIAAARNRAAGFLASYAQNPAAPVVP